MSEEEIILTHDFKETKFNVNGKFGTRFDCKKCGVVCFHFPCDTRKWYPAELVQRNEHLISCEEAIMIQALE